MRKSNVGRKCSICSHDELETINELIGKKSFRAISRQFQGDDSMRDAIRRHAENCLSQLPEKSVAKSNIQEADLERDIFYGVSPSLENITSEDDAAEKQNSDFVVIPDQTQNATEEMAAEDCEIAENKTKEELSEAIRQTLLRKEEERQADWSNWLNRPR